MPKATSKRAYRATLDDIVHTGPGTLGGRYLRSFWQPVFVAEQLKPGWAFPIGVMSENFTLYRGAGGTAHTVAFRCPHRGTQLSSGRVEGDFERFSPQAVDLYDTLFVPDILKLTRTNFRERGEGTSAVYIETVKSAFEKSHIPVADGGAVLRYEDLGEDVRRRTWDPTKSAAPVA